MPCIFIFLALHNLLPSLFFWHCAIIDYILNQFYFSAFWCKFLQCLEKQEKQKQFWDPLFKLEWKHSRLLLFLKPFFPRHLKFFSNTFAKLCCLLATFVALCVVNDQFSGNVNSQLNQWSIIQYSKYDNCGLKLLPQDIVCC